MPNSLIHETSPYLLQHAHNPVDWFAWKPEAFEKARRENKPLLVSIGYSTCHWCHVMERESFENEEVAAYMNEYFVCIKVDREERPDVDQIYMEACQAINGNGGWPLNAFLLPDGRPFFAGTYYPPVSGYGRPSWMELLQRLAHYFYEKKEVVEDQANRLMEILRGSNANLLRRNFAKAETEDPFQPVVLDKIFEQLSNNFDRLEGGFGGAPKFPGAMSLEWLLTYHHFSGKMEALSHALFSLEKMCRGGIYDQLGGGFARYATDRAWLIPHFEKMLYDNALMVRVLADAYQLTGNPLFKYTIEETLEWVAREMTSPEGGFYSALDADSEGVEGKFYVWEKSEIERILGDDAALFNEFYGVSDEGNWEHKNILWRPWSEEDFAKAKKMPLPELKTHLAKARKKLFDARSKRVRPGLDDKILLDWNVLMCTAYARAFKVLGREEYRQAALRNLYFLTEKFAQPDGMALFHTYKNGIAQYDAFLDDYAFLIEAMLEAYEISFDPEWLRQAARWTDFVVTEFFDESQSLFFFTAVRQEQLVVRRKDIFDNATPSGNAVMAKNLQRLGVIFENVRYREIAANMLQTALPAIQTYPSALSKWSLALTAQVYPIREIAVVGERAMEFAAAINRRFVPNAVLMASAEETEDFPLLAGKPPEAETMIYLCQNYACQRPVTSVEEFFNQLF